jgi:peptide/nickel transport system permease protein
MRSFAGKLVRLVVVLLVLTMVSFFAQSLLPGDPAQLIVLSNDKAKIEETRRDLGLDRPVIARYVDWLGDFVTGDMGTYYRSRGGTPGEKVAEALPTSILLMIYCQIVALLIAIPLGVVAAYRANSLFDRSANIAVFLALSVPGFVVAYLLKKYLALDSRLLPESGWVAFTDDPAEHIRHAILPVLALVSSQIAVYFRLLRSDMIATLQEDFITMAKAKGLRPRRILFRHALRPSSLTLLTVAGLNVGTLISAAVLVERIFKVPGMGYLLVEGVLSREYSATQSMIALIGILFVLVNFAVDSLYSVLDPRIRHAR